MTDPRAVRVALAVPVEAVPPLVLEPPHVPIAPAHRPVGEALAAEPAAHGGGAVPAVRIPADGDRLGLVVVDGEPAKAELVMLDGERGLLRTAEGPSPAQVLLLPPAAVPGIAAGMTRREVVVDGWRIVVDVESASRAALRERASRGRGAASHSGPTEVRAIIPGVVLAVSVAAGDAVDVGQQLLVVEAMKMQNEVRAPRAGTVERVAVGPGRRIEVGDELLVIG